MKESLLDRIRRSTSATASAIDTIGFVWLWVVISLGLLGLVVLLNPAKFGAYLWFMSKLSGAASLGYAFDVAFFRGDNPRYLEGLERTMAQTRRATLIAAALIAAGLIG